MEPSVAFRVPYHLFEQEPTALRECVQRCELAGLDRLTVGDHVSFHGGQGFDGILNCAVLAAITQTLTVQTSVYLLGLRHPTVSARQIASVANLAPGRFVLGVGLGGEDRREWEVCGVDPASRGKRLDECIEIVSGLLTGKVVDHYGSHFQLSGAQILPSPPCPVPVVVGGRSEAALRRTALKGDGWLGLFTTPERFQESVERISELAATAGRSTHDWIHGMHFWCSFDKTPDRLAAAMEKLYQLPFSKFERYAVWGDPSTVANAVRPFTDAGAVHVNLAPVGGPTEELVDGAAEVRRILSSSETA